MISQATIFELAGPISLIAVFGLYLRWLQVVEPMHERTRQLRDAIEGKRFVKGDVAFQVERLTFSERTDLVYHITKRVPLFRTLQGSVEIALRSDEREVSLRADGIGFEDYFWSKESLGEFLPKSFSQVDYLGTSTADNGTETKIRIHSLDDASIQEILEQVPAYIQRTLENYPGDAQFHDRA